MIIVECVSWFTLLASIAASAVVIAWGVTPRDGRRRKRFLYVGLVMAFLAFITIVLSAGLVFIQPVDRGVVISALDEGVRSEAIQPGLNWVVPYLETVIAYPISRQNYAMTIVPREGPYVDDDLVQVETADGDKRYVGASVLFAIDPTSVVMTHIMWKGAYKDNLVRPVVRGIIRDVFPKYESAQIDPDLIELIEEQIQDEAEPLFEDGGLLLLEFTLTEVLTEQEYSTLLEQRRSEEPEKDVSMVSGRDLEGIRSILQTVACSAFPVVILVAVMLRARRKDVGSEPPRLAENDEVHDAQAIGIEGFKPSSPEEYYFLGKVLLDRGEFAQAIKAFTEAYRVAEDPILKNEALKQLEGLDAVKKL